MATLAGWRSFLARQFIDYEPGIHYPQFQMQAGTTGVNTIRVCNPVKQSLEKDPEAVYKKMDTGTKDLPLHLIHEPWKITPMEEAMYDFGYGVSYPKIVNIEETGKYAREKLWGTLKSSNSKNHAKRFYELIHQERFCLKSFKFIIFLMNVVVFGATGAVGNALVKNLLDSQGF